jgi:hypothetical protein
MKQQIVVKPQTVNAPSNPIDDLIEVEVGRVHNPPAPLQQLPIPSLNGDPKGRPWSNWAARQLAGSGSVLYIGIPTLQQNDDGSWVVASKYMKTGSTSEAAMLVFPKIPEWGGGRGDSLFAGNLTYEGIANAQGETFWLGVNPGGWVGHVTARNTVTICGMAVGPDTVIKPAGVSKQLYGTFDRPLKNPNDIALDRSLIPGNQVGFMQTVCYIADTGTTASNSGRIAKLVHTMSGTPYERFVETTTYADLPGRRPYGLVYQLDGEIWCVDRTSGELLWVKPNGQAPTVIADGFSEPFRLDLFSDGSVLVSDWSGGRKLTEVSPSGAKRPQGIVMSKQGYVTTFWYETYVDRAGAQGPVDDIITLGYGTGRNIHRRGRHDGYGMGGIHTADDGSWLVSGSATIRQGLVKYIQEVDWHYGWGLGGSPTEAKMAFTGDAGSAALTEIYFPSPALFAEFAKFDKALFDRGKAVWAKGTTPETGLLRPSPRMHMGIHGQNFVHGYTFEQRVAEALEPGGMPKWAEWVRGGTAAHPGGMGSMIPRPEVTNADVRALLYYAFSHTSLGQAGLSPSIIDGEALPPTPPPDVTGPEVTVTGWPIEPVHTVSLTVQATDPSGVAFAALFVDNEEVARDAVHPFALDYEFQPDADSGPHPFSVVAEDMAGNRTVVPTVIVEKPFAPTVDAFVVVPVAIAEGESATLSWETSHAAVVTLNGEVVAADGVMSVAPVVTTTYDLVADGVSHQRVTLAVRQPDVELRINRPGTTYRVIEAQP